jgi:hypothetical protein
MVSNSWPVKKPEWEVKDQTNNKNTFNVKMTLQLHRERTFSITNTHSAVKKNSGFLSWESYKTDKFSSWKHLRGGTYNTHWFSRNSYSFDLKELLRCMNH